MNDSIVFDKEKKKYILSEQMVEVIKKLSRSRPLYKGMPKEITQEFEPGVLESKINDYINETISTIRFDLFPQEGNEIGYDVTKISTLVQKFNNLYPQANRVDREHFKNLSLDKIAELVFVINELEEEQEHYYLTRDLIEAKEDCLINMSYFLDEATINDWQSEYDRAIASRDINKMKELLTHIQEMILVEWQNFFPPLDEMDDNNFIIIGHSTYATNFTGEFFSKYVSCSLYTPGLTDTLRGGYGLLMGPEDIVGAKSQDMYINNYVTDEKALLPYSSIPKIDHPKRIIAEALDRKRGNIANGSIEKVYTEVIKKGFKPIAIFCFTDGSKGFNRNQQNAEKLQKSFPNLKIKSFDVMAHTKGNDLIEMKLNLLNSIQTATAPNSFHIKIDLLDAFAYFFEEFTKLKQKSYYDEKMIEEIFNHNKKMISIFDTDPDDLFKEDFTSQDIKYILRKNSKYNLDNLLAGKAILTNFIYLKKLYPYKDKISNMFEDIAPFLEVLQKIEITTELLYEINHLKPLNFSTIAKYLTSQVEISEKQKQTELEKEYNLLTLEYQKCSFIEEQYKYYWNINNNKAFISLIEKDYEELISEIKKEEMLKTEQTIKLADLQHKEFLLKQTPLPTEYAYSEEHIKIASEIIELSLSIKELAKHSFLNFWKIKKSKKKIKRLQNQEEQNQTQFNESKKQMEQVNSRQQSSLTSEIEMLKVNLTMNSEKLALLTKQLTFLKSKIKTYYDCDTPDEASAKIEESISFLNQYDYLNTIKLSNLSSKIAQIEKLLSNYQGTPNLTSTTGIKRK